MRVLEQPERLGRAEARQVVIGEDDIPAPRFGGERRPHRIGRLDARDRGREARLPQVPLEQDGVIDAVLDEQDPQAARHRFDLWS